VPTMLLLDLPEEILFVVLESAIIPLDPRLSLPDPQSLLTCRTIHRIGLPILYQSILLRSNSQALRVESTILNQPKLVCHIRHLYSSALTSWLSVFRAIGDAKGSLQTLDFVFHISFGGSQPLFGGENVWQSLSAVPVRRLVVRQGPGFFPGRSPVAAGALARAIEGWTSLVRAFVARTSFLLRPANIQKKQIQEVAIVEPRLLFRVLIPHEPSPLALALSRSPSLRVLRVPLPPAWNSSLLIASENPSLVRIVLTKPFLSLDGLGPMDVEVSIPELLARHDDHPWLVEAQKHRRLMRLVGANQGTHDM
jgi:hypothetical protein